MESKFEQNWNGIILRYLNVERSKFPPTLIRIAELLRTSVFDVNEKPASHVDPRCSNMTISISFESHGTKFHICSRQQFLTITFDREARIQTQREYKTQLKVLLQCRNSGRISWFQHILEGGDMVLIGIARKAF